MRYHLLADALTEAISLRSHRRRLAAIERVVAEASRMQSERVF